jgi:hypothetical protein
MQEGGEDETPAPSSTASPYSDHRALLIRLICEMSPEGFEHFCGEILARVGVDDVEVTQFVRDRGM